jgi:hypothetical protein
VRGVEGGPGMFRDVVLSGTIVVLIAALWFYFS